MKSFGKKIIIATIVCMVVLPTTLFASNANIRLVKNGTFNAIDHVTIGNLFSTVFNDPGQWESFVAKDGHTYVNAVYVDDEYQTWGFQFRVFKNQTFNLTYMECDGEGTSDNDEMLAVLYILAGYYNLM